MLLCPVVPCSSLAIYKTQPTNKTVLEKGKEKAKGEKKQSKVTRVKQRIDWSNIIVTNVVVLCYHCNSYCFTQGYIRPVRPWTQPKRTMKPNVRNSGSN